MRDLPPRRRLGERQRRPRCAPGAGAIQRDLIIPGRLGEQRRQERPPRLPALAFEETPEQVRIAKTFDDGHDAILNPGEGNSRGDTRATQFFCHNTIGPNRKKNDCIFGGDAVTEEIVRRGDNA
jgi:hypothetical protein